MLLMEKLYLNMSVEKRVNLEFDFSSSFYILGVHFRDTVPCSSKKTHTAIGFEKGSPSHAYKCALHYTMSKGIMGNGARFTVA